MYRPTAIVLLALGLFGLSAADYGTTASSCGCSNSSIHQIVPVPTSIAAAIPAGRPFQMKFGLASPEPDHVHEGLRRIVRAGDLVYVTGVSGIDLVTNALVSGGVQAEALKAVQNLRALLGLVGCDLGNIVMLTVLVADISDVTSDDSGIAQAFTNANQPIQFAALKYVAGIFTPGANVEIAAIANGCNWPS